MYRQNSACEVLDPPPRGFLLHQANLEGETLRLPRRHIHVGVPGHRTHLTKLVHEASTCKADRRQRLVRMIVDQPLSNDLASVDLGAISCTSIDLNIRLRNRSIPAVLRL